MQRPIDRLDRVRGALRDLSLSEKDLNAGVVMARISDLRAGVNHLTLALGGSEQWLIEWLTKEHAKGCVLYAAAKINKSRNGPLDASPADPRSREFIMAGSTTGPANSWPDWTTMKPPATNLT